MRGVAVLIPVLGRPGRIRGLLASLSASEGEIRIHPVFIYSAGDTEEIYALDSVNADKLRADWRPGRADYAKKMNMGYAWAVRRGFEWIMLAADDVQFHPGWAEAALRTYQSSGACVIGTNDLKNPKVMAGEHSTHTLVHRDYVECGTADEEGKLLCELYDHQWVDNEFVETAQYRGTYAHSHDSLVEHFHPVWGNAEEDSTYAKGQADGVGDQRLYFERCHMWGR